MNKFLDTDQQVVDRLMDNVIGNEVHITETTNSLIVNTTFRSGFRTSSECSSVKGYLRRNGFTSNCGVFSRPKQGTVKGIDLLERMCVASDGFPSGYFDRKRNTALSPEDVEYFSKWLKD